MYEGPISVGDTVEFETNGRKLIGTIIRHAEFKNAWLIRYGDGFCSWRYRSEILRRL
jgi:hypothetical protein